MNTEMVVPVSWIITMIATLGGVIATLAGIIYKLMQSRMAAQDSIIEAMRRDIERLVRGCGLKTCLWRDRCDNTPP